MRLKLKLPPVLDAQPWKLNWCSRYSYPTLIVCLFLIHVRSFTNCHRLMASNPYPIHCMPSCVYGMLPENVIFGGPAVLSMIPLLSVPHSRSGQSWPAASGLPDITQRSQATVVCHSKLGRII